MPWARGIKLASLIVSALLTANCQTAPSVSEQAYKTTHGRWPVMSLDDYKPYPDEYKGDKYAYVDFGTGNKFLKYTLGCAVAAMPYETFSDRNLSLAEDANLIKPERDPAHCQPEIIAAEEKLDAFFARRVTFGHVNAEGLLVKSKAARLQLTSIARIFGEEGIH